MLFHLKTIRTKGMRSEMREISVSGVNNPTNLT